MREMFLYPWDVLDAGIPAVADNLKQWHIESVAIAGVYHQARMLLPHNPVRKLMMHKSSCCYFPIHAERYGALVPRSPDPAYIGLWERIRTELSRQGIGMTAWCVLMHSSYQCAAHPHLAITNIYGDRSPSSLCPSRPEVQDYVVALACDLKASGIDQMDAESLDYAGFLHGDHHEMQAYADTATLDRLLGLCFCEACQARARRMGIDVDALMTQVRAAADAFLLGKELPSIDESLLGAYDAMRCQTVAELAQRMKDESGIAIRPILWMGGDASPALYGVDLKLHTAKKAMICYPSAPEETAGFVARAKTLIPENVQLTGGVRLMTPQTVRPEQGPAYESAYAAAGVKDTIYYNYGMSSLTVLNALRGENP